MNKVVMISTAFAALAGGSAFAADMPLKAPAAVYSWTGCYIGGNAGADLATAKFSSVPNAAFIAGAAFGAPEAASEQAKSAATIHRTGPTFGGGIGCNYQTSIWVFGVETDINFTDIGKRVIRGPFPRVPDSLGFTWEDRFKSDFFGTVRGRVGVLATPTSLLYVTGGLAYKDVSFTEALDFPGFAGFRYEGSNSKTKTGWAAGGGWEFVLGGPWSAKIEYLHIDVGSLSAFAHQNSNPAGANGWTHTVRLTEDVARFGINYRLGGP